MTQTISVKRLSGAVACVAIGLIGTLLPALVLELALVLVLVAVIASEQIAAAGRRARGEPTPLERLEASA
jgi:uncharacterized protein (DUF2062 family)